MGDSLLLSSVFQFSRKIRQSIDKTAGKIRWVGKKLLLLLKMSVPINIPSIKKDTSRRNVCHRKLSLKKTVTYSIFSIQKDLERILFSLFLLFISFYMKRNIRKVLMDRTSSSGAVLPYAILCKIFTTTVQVL